MPVTLWQPLVVYPSKGSILISDLFVSRQGCRGRENQMTKRSNVLSCDTLNKYGVRVEFLQDVAYPQVSPHRLML